MIWPSARIDSPAFPSKWDPDSRYYLLGISNINRDDISSHRATKIPVPERFRCSLLKPIYEASLILGGRQARLYGPRDFQTLHLVQPRAWSASPIYRPWLPIATSISFIAKIRYRDTTGCASNQLATRSFRLKHSSAGWVVGSELFRSRIYADGIAFSLVVRRPYYATSQAGVLAHRKNCMRSLFTKNRSAHGGDFCWNYKRVNFSLSLWMYEFFYSRQFQQNSLCKSV